MNLRIYLATLTFIAGFLIGYATGYWRAHKRSLEIIKTWSSSERS